MFVSYITDHNREYSKMTPRQRFVSFERNEFTFKMLKEHLAYFENFKSPEDWSIVIMNYKFISKEEYEFMTQKEPSETNTNFKKKTI